MDTAGYVTLSRQTGLMQELQTLANNVANASTTGFRREGMVFSEYVARMGDGPSLSMAAPLGRRIDPTQGALTATGGALDLAIQGDGFFQISTPQGTRLTRDGAFSTDAGGFLVTMDGYQVLDAGGSPIFIPPDAGPPAIGRDGTVSSNGTQVAQIGLVVPTDPNGMTREGSGLFAASGDLRPADAPVMLQGFTEASNVNPVAEISRLIEVQHAYEQGQKFLDQEDERIRSVISTLGR